MKKGGFQAIEYDTKEMCPKKCVQKMCPKMYGHRGVLIHPLTSSYGYYYIYRSIDRHWNIRI